LACAGLLGQARAVSLADWEACSAVPGDVDRLACYDRVSGRAQPEAGPVSAPEAERASQPAPPPVVAQAVEPEPKLLSTLSRHWELETKLAGRFLFRRTIRIVYALKQQFAQQHPIPGVVYPAWRLDPVRPMQLSFKIKGMEGMLGHDDVDLWFGYTVTSFWQAYNSSVSSPFRETNYEPEAMLVLRTNYEIAGFRGRFINLGWAPVRWPSGRLSRS
jgi:phospholipase A1